jgi:hypothetical protein
VEGDAQRLTVNIPRHVGLQMPRRQQHFGVAPWFGVVVADIDGSCLGINNENRTNRLQ